MHAHAVREKLPINCSLDVAKKNVETHFSSKATSAPDLHKRGRYILI